METAEVLREYQRFIKDHGFEKMPLHDEALRPLLRVMWRVREQVDESNVIAFDNEPPGRPLTRIYPGLLVPMVLARKAANAFIVEVGNEACRALAQTKAHQKLTFTMGMKNGSAVLYHDQLWCPVGALGKGRN
jgi:hypothetical protein